MSCKCGFILPIKAKFCPECGCPAPIPELKVEIQPIKQVAHILTVNEAAEFLKISTSKLYELISQNKIPSLNTFRPATVLGEMKICIY